MVPNFIKFKESVFFPTSFSGLAVHGQQQQRQAVVSRQPRGEAETLWDFRRVHQQLARVEPTDPRPEAAAAEHRRWQLLRHEPGGPTSLHQRVSDGLHRVIAPGSVVNRVHGTRLAAQTASCRRRPTPRWTRRRTCWRNRRRRPFPKCRKISCPGIGWWFFYLESMLHIVHIATFCFPSRYEFFNIWLCDYLVLTYHLSDTQ